MKNLSFTKVLSAILLISILISVCPVQAFASLSKKEEATHLSSVSGTCGTGTTWSLTDGVLTLSGEGAVSQHPWWTDTENYFIYWVPKYNYSIKKVVVEEGITSICDFAFYYAGLQELEIIGNTLKSIGIFAFGDNSDLKGQLTLPSSLTIIHGAAFCPVWLYTETITLEKYMDLKIPKQKSFVKNTAQHSYPWDTPCMMNIINI